MQPDDGLVEWLHAQLDEDERQARAAVIPAHEGPGAYQPHPELATWRYVPGGEVEYVSTPEMLSYEYAEPYRVTCDSEGLGPAVDESVGPHIARHDPARVLAQVAAYRAILELHQPKRYEHDSDGIEHNLEPHEWDCEHDLEQWPCPTVRHLTTVYADREGWREEWRPA